MHSTKRRYPQAEHEPSTIQLPQPAGENHEAITHAVIVALLITHERVIGTLGEGITCACGTHHRDTHQWHHHHAELITTALARIP